MLNLYGLEYKHTIQKTYDILHIMYMYKIKHFLLYLVTNLEKNKQINGNVLYIM